MTNETISNEYKAVEIATQSQFLSDFPHHKESVEYGAITTMQWKDEQHAIEKQQWIEKAINFLAENLYTHKVDGNVGVNYVRTKDDMNVTQTEFMYLFKKAMEEL